MERRFVTRAEIDRLADAGELVLELGPRATVTDLAAERARERGVRLVREAAAEDVPLRDRVRSAVVAALGDSPVGLDDAIDKVLRGR